VPTSRGRAAWPNAASEGAIPKRAAGAGYSTEGFRPCRYRRGASWGTDPFESLIVRGVSLATDPPLRSLAAVLDIKRHQKRIDGARCRAACLRKLRTVR
jgi:hypothetical protein